MPRIDLLGAFFVIVVALVLPALAIQTRRLLGSRELPLPRPLFYYQTIVVQLLLYAFALLAASTNHLVLNMWPRSAKAWLPAVALLAAGVVLLRLTWPLRSEEARRQLAGILPAARAELPPYLLLCVVAAVAEEVAYRGVAIRFATRLWLPLPAAVVVVALLFAAAHALQGWRSAAVIFLFALGFHWLVIETRALAPAIAVHCAYDVLAGLLIPRWFRTARQ
jgi:membrane protease YdiL (CAAX protease family)